MTASAPKRRPRFSLLNLLLLMAVVAMGITIAQLRSELVSLRAENERLRDEVGELTITDPTKLHAILAPGQGELVWKWRVWVPARRTYRLRSYGGLGKVPESGFPDDGGTLYLRPANNGEGQEVWVEYRIEKGRDGEWRGRLRTATGGVGVELHPWANSKSLGSRNVGVLTSTAVAEEGKPFLLMKYRILEPGTDIPDPADGFMVWIEPQ